MYFSSRDEAGYRLALQLLQYRNDNTIVVCLSDGAVVVGKQISASLHCVMTLFLSSAIDVPGEGVQFGSLNQSGRFTYNSEFSKGEVEAYYTEFHGYLEDQKREGTSKLNRLMGEGGAVDPTMLKDHVVIVVSDGIEDGAALDAIADFLRPIRLKKLVFASPTASVEAVDRLHVLADEMHVLGVTHNFMDVNHYYDRNDIPEHETILKILSDTVLTWR